MHKLDLDSLNVVLVHLIYLYYFCLEKAWAICFMSWAPLQYSIRRLILRSREVSKPRDWSLWNYTGTSAAYKSRGFETWWDLTKRRLMRYWNRALDAIFHYDDVIMTTMASQITSLTIVYSIVYSDADQRKYQSSASLTFVWGIHRGPVNSPHKWPVTRKMFPFDDVIMENRTLEGPFSSIICIAGYDIWLKKHYLESLKTKKLGRDMSNW